MQAYSQPVHLPEPQVFQYSLDWRFLLPVADPNQMRVASEAETGLREALDRIGIPASNQLLDLDSVMDERSKAHSFVFPFGLPVHWVGARPEEQIELYRAVRERVCPGGYFLLGFQNSWISRSKSRYHASSPRSITERLSQAGFKSIEIFGAMPDLRIPEYIFELGTQTMYFAWQHRFRRKPVFLNVLQMLAGTIGLAGLSNLCPCYFAVATA